MKTLKKLLLWLPKTTNFRLILLVIVKKVYVRANRIHRGPNWASSGPLWALRLEFPSFNAEFPSFSVRLNDGNLD